MGRSIVPHLFYFFSRIDSFRLEHSRKLEKKAQKWAEHLLTIRRLEHSDDREVGENVAYKFASDQRIFSGQFYSRLFQPTSHESRSDCNSDALR